MAEKQQKNIFLQISKRFKLPEHRDSILYTITNIFISHLLIAISIYVQYRETSKLDLNSIGYTGEIYIVSASMGAASMYNLFIASKYKVAWVNFLFTLTLIMYTASLALYFNLPKPGNTNLNTSIQNTTILILFIVNFITVHYSHYYQNLKTDVISMRSEQLDDMRSKFFDIADKDAE